jgi:hydrogenase maturation protease
MPIGADTRVGIIGVGNSYASDDGAGIRALRLFRELVQDARVDLKECERGGMDLLDCLEGLDSAFVLDAALTGVVPPGEIQAHTIPAPFTTGACPSLHTLNLRGLLAFGEATGMSLPRDVTVLSVEAEDIETFREGCTPNVERVLPEVVERLMKEVRRILPDVCVASSRGDAAMLT